MFVYFVIILPLSLRLCPLDKDEGTGGQREGEVAPFVLANYAKVPLLSPKVDRLWEWSLSTYPSHFKGVSYLPISCHGLHQASLGGLERFA